MTKPAPALDLSTRDPVLDDLIYEITEKIGSGEPVDLDRYARDHPEHIERLRQLLPTLEVMIDLSRLSGGLSTLRTVGGEEEGLSRGVLGDYRILREAGRGGMGVVYEAEQISLGRRVALKVLPFAAVMDSRQLQRFKNEAQAAAHLQHQNIVPVYAVGCERGVHFYAMQFVEGQSLAAVIEQLRQRAGLEREAATSVAGRYEVDAEKHSAIVDGSAGAINQIASQLASGRFQRRSLPEADAAASEAEASLGKPPSEADTQVELLGGLSTKASTNSRPYFRSIANLGLQAADALDHAHRRDVIHRDIKPSNLILDVEGNLWVTDFGLARIESEHSLTMTGDVLGTLRYMSPEQAMARPGGVDHRSDLYSLGATLYELLTLEPAFSGRDRQELLRQITFEEPRPPRRINPAIPTDLETIVLKAMAKEPEDRYPTAGELGDDLRRFLENKPIRAKRPSLLQRTVKWSRRHRGIVTTATATTMIALVMSTALVWRAQNKTAAAYRLEKVQRLLAQRNAELAEERRGQAERNLELARQTVEDTFALVTSYDLRVTSSDAKEEILFQLLKLYREVTGGPDANSSMPKRDTPSRFRPERIKRQFGIDSPAEGVYRDSLSNFEELAAAFKSRRADSLSRPNSEPDGEAGRQAKQPPNAAKAAPLVNNAGPGESNSRIGRRGPRLLSSSFFPGAGQQKSYPQMAGITIVGDRIYLSGCDANALSGRALALCLDLPKLPESPPVLRWKTHWPDAGFSFPGGEAFLGVVAIEEGVVLAGTSYHETTDTQGGKEGKAVLVKFRREGPVGDGVGGADWAATQNFFPYSGVEFFYDVKASKENGSTFLYAAGRAETSGNLNLSKGDFNVTAVIAKYDVHGHLVKQTTVPGVSFDLVEPTGYSVGTALAVANSRVFLVGTSALTEFGEDEQQRPFLAKFDTDLNQIWRQRDGSFSGVFIDVIVADGAIYAVGSSGTTGIEESKNYLIQKYRDDSTRLWSVEFGGDGVDDLTGVVNIDDRLFAVGYTNCEGAGGSDAVLFEFDPDDGEVLSKTLFGGPEDDRAEGVATDGKDLYVVGTSRSFGPGGVDTQGQSHVMLLRFSLEPAT